MTSTRYTRDDVIAAAGRLFAERGYHGTSMRDLGRELGLHGSSLYTHVTSKQDLLVDIVERGALLFQASVDRAVATTSTPADRLCALISGHLDVVLDHIDEARTFLNEARALDARHRRRVIGWRNTYESAFRDTISRGVEDGTFSGNTDPVLASIFALSILNAVDRWYDPAGALGRDALGSAIFDQVVDGIG